MRSSRAPASTTTRPSTRESISSPSIRRSRSSSTRRLASSMSSSWPGVLPPAADRPRLDSPAVVDQALDRVGDLELAARGRLDRLARPRTRAGRTCRRRRAPGSRAGPRASRPGGRPARRRARRPRSASGRAPASAGSARRARSARKASTRSTIPSRSRLSPRYMTNGASPRNSSAVSTACASPSGSSWSM